MSPLETIAPARSPRVRAARGRGVRLAASASSTTVGLVLDLDPELGAGLLDDEWPEARLACTGSLLSVPSGSWEVPGPAGERNDLLGLLITDGMLCREVSLRDSSMLELLGPGDVLQLPVILGRPSLGSRVRLTALSDAILVGLGESFIRAAGRWPSLLAALHRRVESQREYLAVQGLICHLARAEHRVLLQLWHLAERWGRVTREGTLLPLVLTHDLLGQLSAARRSTVTLAVKALESDGLIGRSDDGSWVLTAAAEARVAAIARAHRPDRVLGEALKLRQAGSPGLRAAP